MGAAVAIESMGVTPPCLYITLTTQHICMQLVPCIIVMHFAYSAGVH